MQNKQNLSVLTKGILKENPVFILMLGTCPTLATTNNVFGAFGMGIAAMIVLLCSNVLISLLRRVIPNAVRIPCYIVIIAGFVTVVKLCVRAFLPALYDILGVYLDLITVNCIILGRAEMFAGKNSVGASALDGIGMGLGFTLALTLMATVREVLGNGSFAGIVIPFMESLKIPILTKAPGGFLVYGILIGVMNKLTEKKGGVKKKSFSCDGCPSSHLCNKTSCAEVTELVAEALDTVVESKEIEIENAEAKEVSENA